MVGYGYSYGFHGMESDDEVKGEGNSINYKLRMYDPRVGRFFVVDPLEKDYPYYSPYAFSGNRVIDAVEEEGLQPRIVTVGRVQVSFRGNNKTTGNFPIGITLTDKYKSTKLDNEKSLIPEDNRPVCKKVTSIYISDRIKTLDNHVKTDLSEEKKTRERTYESENSINIRIDTYSLGDKIEIIDSKTGETLFIDEEAIEETFYTTKPGQSVKVKITADSGYEINVTTVERKKIETVRTVNQNNKTINRERSISTPEKSEESGYTKSEKPCNCEEDE